MSKCRIPSCQSEAVTEKILCGKHMGSYASCVSGAQDTYLYKLLDEVVSGNIVQGAPMRDWCSRSQDELVFMRMGAIPFVYNERHAIKCIRTLEQFKTRQNKRYKFYWWENICALQFFGQLHSQGTRIGRRRFTVIVIYSAKGSGKSPFAGLLGIWMTNYENKPFAWTVVAASDYNQTKQLFDNVGHAIATHPVTSRRCQIIGKTDWKSYMDTPTRSVFQRLAYSKEGFGSSGPELRCVIADEAHQLRNFDQKDELTANFKSDPQPLECILANAMAAPNLPFSGTLDQAKKVASWELDNYSILPMIFDLDFDQEDEKNVWTDRRIWIKTNPSLTNDQPGYDYIQGEINKSRGIPAKEAGVGRRQFCIPTESESPIILRQKLIELETVRLNEDVLVRCPAVLGVDLSKTRDLPSVSTTFIVSPKHSGADEWQLWTRNHSFTQREDLEIREKEDGAPYREYVENGWMTIIEESYIRLRWIAKYIDEVYSRYKLLGIAFDAHRIKQLIRSMDENYSLRAIDSNTDSEITQAGDRRIRMYGHQQGWKVSACGLSMPISMDIFFKHAKGKTISIERNLLLRGCTLGASARFNEDGDCYPSKGLSETKIDPFTAQVMSLGLAQRILEDMESKVNLFENMDEEQFGDMFAT